MTAPELVKVADVWGDEGTVQADASDVVIGAPVVRVRAFDNAFDPEPLDFTPAQAREFAAAIVAAADSLDPEGARPLAVVDSDGDVWHYQADTGVYAFGDLAYVLDRIREDYGPLTEVRA